ncbi:MAG TPA: hypothetical protein PLN56_08225 [Methanoregulaceae archaeon]|nr:MAG: hypothetical protein IPI71_04445 [Methanolinea sp.]HON82045.1 hypothetical protein [Methanoregulaceae archaeon]HPD10969.1 hypothetical protein [Methanoregulaceae archaeon]HRT15900.1 hypothetical protein [Methanoregulaceae archaeon]HRU31366.1 hypothetical protein [Methanoregulaceae archaeon]
MIREVILGAGAIYLAVLFLQLVQRPSTALGAIIAGSVLGLATGLYWYDNEHHIHKWERFALWVAVLLFLIYGIFTYPGVL